MKTDDLRQELVEVQLRVPGVGAKLSQVGMQQLEKDLYCVFLHDIDLWTSVNFCEPLVHFKTEKNMQAALEFEEYFLQFVNIV